MTGCLSPQNQWKNQMKKDKKALFLDMDGTTLDDHHQLSQKNREALQRCISAGHEVVITTGRPAASAGYLLRTYRLDEIGCRYVISYNGGLVLDCKTMETLFQYTLPFPYTKILAEKARQEGLYLQTYEDHLILSEHDDENLAHYMEKTSMKVKIVSDIAAALTKEPCKMLAIDLNSRERLEHFIAQMQKWSEDKVDMYLSCAEYLEIVPKGVCKGKALRDLCQRLGIAIEHTVAAGDEANDISMLKAAEIGCAVANAQESVKQAADYITANDNNHAAVAEIVERFMI